MKVLAIYHEQAREAQRLCALLSLRQLQSERWQSTLAPQLTAEALSTNVSARLNHCLKGGSVGPNGSGSKVYCHEAGLIGWDDELRGLG